MFWSEILQKEFYKNTVWEWGMAAVISVFIFLLFLFLKKKGLQKIKRFIVRNPASWSGALLDTLENTKLFVLFLLSLYIGLRGLDLPEMVENNARIIAFGAFFVQIGLWFTGLLNAWSNRYRDKQIKSNPAAVTTFGAVKLILHTLIWVSVLLLILDNMGLDITALVAGLGIGGVAIALAVQNILGDLFASLSIVLDKTFTVGDFVIVDNYMGTVENIGLKTTRVRSLSGEQIVFSNSDLLNGRIRNYGRMYERRVPITIGVIYQTPRAKLKKIPTIIRNAIEAQERVRFDRAHFYAYGESSLDFEYVYYVLSPDYNTYMDINQAINFQIHEQFEKEGIEFAFPTRTLFLGDVKEKPKSKPKPKTKTRTRGRSGKRRSGS